MLLLKHNMIILLMMVMSNYLVMAKPTIDYCSTCQSVSEFIQDMQRNQTEPVMKTNLYKMCLKENNGSNTRTCVFLATTIQNTLKHIGEDDFCSKINACPSKKPFNKPVTIDEERCEFCTNLLDSFKSLIVDTNTNLLKESLNDYCDLTGDFKEECQKNVDKNLVNFLDFAQNKMDSNRFCHVINSCHYQTVEEKKLPQIGDLLSLRDPVQMAGHLEFLEHEQEHKLAINANENAVGGALSCMVCRQVVVMIYSSLHKNATRENVEHLLAKSCKTIYFKNKEKEQKCEDKVVENAEIILTSFINHVHPDIVCLLLGMCFPGQLNEQIKPLPILKEIEEPKIQNQISIFESAKKGIQLAQNYKCYFCEKIVSFLFHELDQTKTREYIKHLLDGSCERLFKKEEREDKCEEYVNAYTDKLIDLIEKASNPGLICNTLHMCPVNYTMITMWDNRRLNIPIENSPVELKDKPVFKIDWCNICKRTYPLLSEAMQVDIAKDYVTEYAHSFCAANILPIKNCSEKADEYIEVIATVKDNIVGCEKLTLCPVDDKKKPGKKIKTERDEIILDLSVFDLASVEPSFDQQQLNRLQHVGFWEDAKCTACKLLIKGVYANLNRTIHSESTKKIIEQTCEHLHQDDLKEKCKQDAIKALETLIKDITHSMPPEQACELMKYCKQKENYDYSTLMKPLAQSSVCNTCKIMFPLLHRVLQNEATRNNIKNFAAKICDQSINSDRCKEIVNEIVDNLANNEDSKFGCSSLCEDNLVTSSIYKVSDCTACQTSMVIIDEIFKNEHVKNRLNNSLENFCDSRGERSVQNNCKSVVRKNLPKLFDLIHNLTDHDNGFCPTMGFCNSTKKNEYNTFINFDLVIDGSDNDDPLKGAADLIPDENELLNDPFFINNIGAPKNQLVCDACKKIMGKIQEDIKDNEDLKDKLLEHLLHTCPKDDDKCRQFYRKYVNYFYKMLIRNTDPDRACPLMKLCPDDFILTYPLEKAEEFKPAINLTESTICKECQTAIQYLINTLNNKTVVDFILKEVQKNVCEPLSYIERKACTRLVKSFGPKIVAHFVKRITEEKICSRQLRLCKDEFDNFISLDKTNSDIDFDLINFVEDPNCIVCTRSVNKLNALRGESSKLYSIEEICGDDDSECKQFMLDFKDFFLKNDYNRDSILACSELDVCLIPGKVQLLGGSKCNFGPAYSCLSIAHSEACKNTDFCRKNYWKAVEN